MPAISLLFRKRNTEPAPVNKKVLLFLVVAILGCVILLQYLNWTHENERSLLPNVTGLTILEDLSPLPNLVPVPSKTFGAELYQAGLYTMTVREFPEGTFALVYIKNNTRFVEIDYLPKLTTETYLSTHIYPTQEVVLDADHSLYIQTIDTQPRCIDYEDTVPNRCEISRMLIADLPNHLLLIAADGTHATDGELIEMARSIVVPTPTLEQNNLGE
ncbi:hypothetical protein HQ487_01900 [Candidatus Uhrbacteria bacterium]|nr:hypothetical protein [Candidatus Uhrbacteria bacterium]